MLDSLLKDVRFAIRQLRMHPGFTCVAISVLALGLGANAAIFTLVNAVLLRPLPYAQPERLVAVFEKDVVPDAPYNTVAVGNYLDWVRYAKSFENLAATTSTAFNLSSSSQSFTPERVPGAICSGNLFRTLGVTPVLGRTFRQEEDRPGAPYTAVISYSLWRQRFAGSPDVLHSQIRLDENSYTIVGVMPEGFAYPRRDSQIWVTLQRHERPSDLASHENHMWFVIGRLRTDHSLEEARQEVDTIVKRFKKDHPAEIMGHGASVITLESYLVRNVKTSLLILLSAVGCLLLIACVNIANLLLTRAVGRQRELAIRAAVGASRPQIVRQLLIESLAISLMGALAGLLLASWASHLLGSHAPAANSLPHVRGLGVDGPVFLFTFALALLTGLLAGIFPALAASRNDLVNSLKDGSRSTTAGRSQGSLRDFLVGLEVCLSLVLVISAGLLLRSFAQVQNVRPGLRTENTVTLNVSLPKETYKERSKVAAFVRQAGSAIANLPGVDSGGLIDCVPLDGECDDSAFHIEGHPLPPGQMMDLADRSVDPSYLKAVGVPLLKGRLFTDGDNQGYDDLHPRLDTVIISDFAARKYFGHLDPIGKVIDFGVGGGSHIDPAHPSPKFQVIGVVGDVLDYVEETKIRGTAYFPMLDGKSNDICFVVHTSNDPRHVIPLIRAQIAKLDPNLPIHHVRTLNEITAESTAGREFSLVLLALFAGLALLLAIVGLYGVVSYAVTQRTGEIGIRMALGAKRTEVSRMILMGGIKPAMAGILFGLMGALASVQALKSMLFGIGTIDPQTFIAVPVLLLVIVVLACLIPAIRATQIDPTSALRAE